MVFAHETLRRRQLHDRRTQFLDGRRRLARASAQIERNERLARPDRRQNRIAIRHGIIRARRVNRRAIAPAAKHMIFAHESLRRRQGEHAPSQIMHGLRHRSLAAAKVKRDGCPPHEIEQPHPGAVLAFLQLGIVLCIFAVAPAKRMRPPVAKIEFNRRPCRRAAQDGVRHAVHQEGSIVVEFI